jgi:hypothetical protein
MGSARANSARSKLLSAWESWRAFMIRGLYGKRAVKILFGGKEGMER